VDTAGVLEQLRALASQAGVSPGRALPAAESDFARLLQGSIAQVSGLQERASGLAQGFEGGDPQVSLSEVVIAREKASLAFQAALQVRNKLVAAYQDIMNMPI
jgi:flagellar hook-basal body complex protein FliE